MVSEGPQLQSMLDEALEAADTMRRTWAGFAEQPAFAAAFPRDVPAVAQDVADYLAAADALRRSHEAHCRAPSADTERELAVSRAVFKAMGPKLNAKIMRLATKFRVATAARAAEDVAAAAAVKAALRRD